MKEDKELVARGGARVERDSSDFGAEMNMETTMETVFKGMELESEERETSIMVQLRYVETV